MPIFDFNQNLYQFRRDGYCANPNTAVKGLLFSSKNEELKNKSEFEGVNIYEKNQEFLQEMFDKTSKKSKKQLTKKYKEQRKKSDNMLSYLGPWAGYGQKI